MDVIKKTKKTVSLRARFLKMQPAESINVSFDSESYARWLATTLKKQTGKKFKVNNQQDFVTITRL